MHDVTGNACISEEQCGFSLQFVGRAQLIGPAIYILCIKYTMYCSLTHFSLQEAQVCCKVRQNSQNMSS